MEAQAILPVRAGGVLKQESASRAMNDVFQAILRDHETRELAPRGETARSDVSRDRAEHDTERPARARRRSDAARETRDDDRYRDTRDQRPEADDIQATDRSARRGQAEESQPRAGRPGPGPEPAAAAAKADTQEHDDAPSAGDTPVETGLGDEGAPKPAAPNIAADPALAGTPAIAATPFTQGADGAAALKPANPKDAVSNAPRPAVIPAAAVAGSRAALNSAVATPAPSQAETAAAPAPAAAKAIQSILPVGPAEAGLPLNAAQVKRTQASGQKAGAPAAAAQAIEIAGAPDKANQTPAAARIQADHGGRKTAASAPAPVKAPAGQAEASQAARAAPAPPSLENPGRRTPVAGAPAAEVLKTAASAGDTGPAPAGLTGIDPMQGAARAAGARPGLAPATDRPVPPGEVAVTIQRAAARGENRIRIRLHPAELGQVEVRLKVGADGIVRAMVQVERPETLDFLQRDARGLERALQDAGLKTDSGSLSFNLRDRGEDGLRDRDGDGDTALAGREPADAHSPSATEAAEIPVHPGGSNRVLDIRV